MCHADFSLTSVEPLLDDLAELQSEVTRELGVRASSEPVHVCLFRDRGAYTRYMRRYFPGVPARKALFIKDRGPGMIFAARTDELPVDLRHESTHALLHAALSDVPLWLDEGLAEYFEVSPAARRSGGSHRRSVRWSARLGRVPRITDLEALQDLTEMKESDYRDSWAWVHFMLHGSAEARQELQHYLSDLSARRQAGRLSDRLRRRLPNLDRAFLTHHRSTVRPQE